MTEEQTLGKRIPWSSDEGRKLLLFLVRHGLPREYFDYFLDFYSIFYYYLIYPPYLYLLSLRYLGTSSFSGSP